ncbi:MAG: TIGR00296 family protein [Thermoplasmata archaeon]
MRQARRALESAVRRDGPVPRSTPSSAGSERAGVFVTLKRYPSNELRGCVGFPWPTLPRGEAIDRAAVAAGLDDPRFPPVEPAELDHLVLEVSLLTSPEPIGAEDADGRRGGVEVGRHGLIVSAHGASGLLLPQVAVEQGWDAETFLDATCEKAGLSRGAWRKPGTRVDRFEAAVFAERSPGGEVGRA